MRPASVCKSFVAPLSSRSITFIPEIIFIWLIIIMFCITSLPLIITTKIICSPTPTCLFRPHYLIFCLRSTTCGDASGHHYLFNSGYFLKIWSLSKYCILNLYLLLLLLLLFVFSFYADLYYYKNNNSRRFSSLSSVTI